MFKEINEQREFLKQFNILEENLRESMLSWNELELIAKHYLEKKDEHTTIVKHYIDELQQCEYVHSLSYRVKEVTHLIEKIIRKNSKYQKKGNAITCSNYYKFINDLMGIRILILFKEDWKGVHEFIMDRYANDLMEDPFAYIRIGDNRNLYEGKVKIIEEKPYRSVHYVIKDKKTGIGVEIQVRTLFEEAWSEIDHKLRYPYNLSNKMVGAYLEIMNRVAGMADEMGTFLHEYLREFERVMEDGISDENEVYDYILNQIQKCENDEIKMDITAKIKKAQNYKALISASEIFKNILKDI